MSCRIPSNESGPSCMYSTMPVQNDPEPTSTGIWSEASNPAWTPPSPFSAAASSPDASARTGFA